MSALAKSKLSSSELRAPGAMPIGSSNKQSSRQHRHLRQLRQPQLNRAANADTHFPGADTHVPSADHTPAPDVPAITPADFGAIGDGVANDTSAMQNALNSLETGETLTIPAGKTYRHTAVLKVSKPGVTIAGSGTLLATAEATSAVHLAANNITLDGVTLAMGSTTKRWVAFEQMKLRIGRRRHRCPERDG